MSDKRTSFISNSSNLSVLACDLRLVSFEGTSVVYENLFLFKLLEFLNPTLVCALLRIG